MTDRCADHRPARLDVELQRSAIPTPLDYLHRYWRQVSPEDRLRFLVEMLTPNERRALQFGFEELDTPSAVAPHRQRPRIKPPTHG